MDVYPKELKPHAVSTGVWHLEKSVIFTRMKMTFIYVLEDSAIEIKV